MELNREQIIKALQICMKNDVKDCEDCPYYGQARCFDEVKSDAIKLIKELSEENENAREKNKWLNGENEKLTRKLKTANLEIECKERICESYMLQYGTVADKEVWLKKERADTVRKMQERLKKYYHHLSGKALPAAVEYHIDQIAKEMLEDAE